MIMIIVYKKRVKGRTTRPPPDLEQGLDVEESMIVSNRVSTGEKETE